MTKQEKLFACSVVLLTASVVRRRVVGFVEGIRFSIDLLKSTIK